MAVTVVDLNTVARIKFSSNLKNSSSAVGYYSYTNRCSQFGKTIFMEHTIIF